MQCTRFNYDRWCCSPARDSLNSHRWQRTAWSWGSPYGVMGLHSLIQRDETSGNRSILAKWLGFDCVIWSDLDTARRSGPERIEAIGPRPAKLVSRMENCRDRLPPAAWQQHGAIVTPSDKAIVATSLSLWFKADGAKESFVCLLACFGEKGANDSCPFSISSTITILEGNDAACWRKLRLVHA